MKLKQRALQVLTVGLAMSSLVGSVFDTNVVLASAEFNDIQLNIDDRVIKTDVAPVLKNGRTLVPVRVIADNLGYEVEWDQSTKTTKLTKDGVSYLITIGDNKIIASNGKIMHLDVSAQTISGRTMLPIRAIVEISGATVEWDNKTQTVFVNSKGEKINLPSNDTVKEDKPSTGNNKGVIEDGPIHTFSYLGSKDNLNGSNSYAKGGGIYLEKGNIFAVSYGDMMIAMDGEVKINSKLIGNYDSSKTLELSKYFDKEGLKYSVQNGVLEFEKHDASYDKVLEKEESEKRQEERAKENDKKKEKEKQYSQGNYTDEEFEELSEGSRYIQPPSDYGFEYIEHRPWDGGSLENVKDIKFVVDDINQHNLKTTVMKTEPLKAGDLYAMSIRETSPTFGFTKGYYVFKIPENAKAIHPSGDMRYGWEDDRMLPYVEKWVNDLRSKYATIPKFRDQGLGPVKRIDKMKNENVENRWNAHRQMMSEYGITPHQLGTENTPYRHYQGGMNGEILSQQIYNLGKLHRVSTDGQWRKDLSFNSFVYSGAHKGQLLDPHYKEFSALMIFRPGMTDRLVISFEE